MIYFLLGFSLCFNILFVVFGIIFYKKYIPIFRSQSNFDLDFNSKDDDFLDSLTNLVNVYNKK